MIIRRCVYVYILVTLWPFYSFCIITLCDYFSIVSFLQFPFRFLWTLFCTYMSPSAAMLHIRTLIEHAHITKGLPDDNNEESQAQSLSPGNLTLSLIIIITITILEQLCDECKFRALPYLPNLSFECLPACLPQFSLTWTLQQKTPHRNLYGL